VLVVDDSAVIRARLVQLLREGCGAGCVLEADSADNALEVFEREAVDVVVLDLHMPGTNGMKIIAELKRGASPPLVVVLTNHPSEHLRRQCISQGADLFLDKSKDFDELIAVVRDPESSRASVSKVARSTVLT
jgi:DNA-binding NarL/FixJ family response regulator